MPTSPTCKKSCYFYSHLATPRNTDTSLARKRSFNAAWASQSAQLGLHVRGVILFRAPPPPGQQCTINAWRQRYRTSVCSGLCDIYCHINAPKETMHEATPAGKLLIQITEVTAMLGRPSGTSSYITRAWKWWNGLAELLHYQRMIASAQTGRSFFTHPQENKKRYGWMIGTHNRKTIKANTHRHKNNIKEILIFHEFASLSRMFKHQRRPICKPYQMNLLVVSQDVIKAVKNH